MMKRFLVSLVCSICFLAAAPLTAQTVAETNDRLTAIEAECQTTFLASKLENEAAMEAFGDCLLAAARIAAAELEAIRKEQDARMAELQADILQMNAFLETLEELRVTAAGNQAALAQIADLRGEFETVAERVAAIRVEADAIEAENDAIRAETAAFKAQSAIYEARIECIWDAIAQDTGADCADPAVYQRFLVD